VLIIPAHFGDELDEVGVHDLLLAQTDDEQVVSQIEVPVGVLRFLLYDFLVLDVSFVPLTGVLRVPGRFVLALKDVQIQGLILLLPILVVNCVFNVLLVARGFRAAGLRAARTTRTTAARLT